jgi:D-alanyl-lipoteichoic acid acyltransferase DltB (MBOAT superfamily)
MQTSNSRQGTLGILWIVYGLTCVVRTAWVLINSATLTLMWGALLNRVANPFFWMSLFHFALLAAVVLMIVTAIISFVAGVALTQGGSSSRTLALAASFFGLITGPLGIALGVFTLVIMIPQPARQLRADSASAA